MEVLGPGYTPLNWNSLGIPEFVETCNNAINEFQSLVNQVQKNSSIITQARMDLLSLVLVLFLFLDTTYLNLSDISTEALFV